MVAASTVRTNSRILLSCTGTGRSKDFQFQRPDHVMVFSRRVARCDTRRKAVERRDIVCRTIRRVPVFRGVGRGRMRGNDNVSRLLRAPRTESRAARPCLRQVQSVSKQGLLSCVMNSEAHSAQALPGARRLQAALVLPTCAVTTPWVARIMVVRPGPRSTRLAQGQLPVPA